MSKRSSIPRKKSSRQFTSGAKNIHPKNNRGTPMRGGIRL